MEISFLLQTGFDLKSRQLHGGPGRDISTELGGKGSFQAAKLQRSARTTVCSHSTRDMAAMRSIESNHDHDDIRYECLSTWEQS